jgi:GPI mannosyltransferase 3
MQGLDIAYKLAFGDQVDYLTAWEWLDSYCLRNLLYPAFLSIPLHVLRALDLDYNLAVVCAPLVMNALLQAIGDVYGYAFVKKFLGKTTA